MKDNTSLNRTVMLFTVRIILALIFLMAGYGKIFTWGIGNVYNSSFASFENTFLPTFLLKFTAYYTSYVELIAGFILLIGFKRDYALYALASVLVIVTYGHGLQSPIWDVKDVIFRTILLGTLLIAPASWDKWQVERLWNK
ncbi:MAG: DoxX family membrane protein [Bacteroidota bacterium]